MKTTVEIGDALLERAKEVAHDHGVSLRQLIEAGLRHEVETRSARGEFRLRDASVGGNGVQAELGDQGWPGVRDAIYEGRGA
ncbi:hypothetical protein [Euzebya sp.]|uniref:hypothetical protein n=1 Tax=Euzebya sp. TaxID=1971409 RepID=UPI0035134A54